MKHPSEFVNIGDNIEVQVLELDVEGRKLSLGHKQTTKNPWDEYEKEFGEGTLLTAEVSEVVDKGALLQLNEDISAFVPSRHMDKEDGKKLKKGESAQFKVIEFNKDFKRVVASHTAVYRDQERRNVKTAPKKKSQAAEKTTLGDLDVLADLKEKMEKGK